MRKWRRGKGTRFSASLRKSLRKRAREQVRRRFTTSDVPVELARETQASADSAHHLRYKLLAVVTRRSESHDYSDTYNVQVRKLGSFVPQGPDGDLIAKGRVSHIALAEEGDN